MWWGLQSASRGVTVLPEPYAGHLAPSHRAERRPRAAGVPLLTVSARLALVEALELFGERPLAALGLGAMWLLATAISGVPPGIAAGLLATSTSGTGALATLPAAVWVLTAAAAALAFAALGTPIFAGVYAAGIRSARMGAPTCEGLSVGFRRYPAAFVVGAVCGLASALAVIPVAGPLLGLLVGTWTWVVTSALGDCPRNPFEVFGHSFRLLWGRVLPLLWLNFCAGLVLWLTALVVAAGATAGAAGHPWSLLVTIPTAGAAMTVAAAVMVLMLSVGYRDALEAAGRSATLDEADAD
jgi:hypothetical protein